MFRRLKFQMMVIGGVIVVAFVMMFFQANDLKTHYTVVDAKITAVAVDCFIKAGRKKIVEKETEKLAYMSCDLAPAVASQFGYSDKDIKKRASVTYQYESPVDHNYYTGSYTRERDVDGLVRGKMIHVHAHLSDPEKSRTTNGNIFVADTGA